jgi:hypothetical protein
MPAPVRSPPATMFEGTLAAVITAEPLVTVPAKSPAS